ncbi:MAG: M61 family metallopeptidase [Acidobacteriota bacterium]|nr:M61 family metallopeptidase [Acidobacteriota bacterium]
MLAHPAPGQTTPIQITADLTDAPRRLMHAEVDLPVAPGPLALTTPKWIPGNHRPTGPASNITGVVFTANGRTLPWRRDDTDLYQFHLVIPVGVTMLHAHLDCIVTGRVTQTMAMLEWENLLLYPANQPVRQIAIQPSVVVPHGWGFGTALVPLQHLDPEHPGTDRLHFAATTVEQLQDSPILVGRNLREIPLAQDVKPAHYLDVAADLPEDLTLRPEFLAAVSNLVREAQAVFGSHHYTQYHFLLTLSDVAGREGLEHGQSSDNGVDEKSFADVDHQLRDATLLPHEFTHSWNGKYRRPDHLYQPDFATMQQGELLWVYEGLTQYLGEVLAARAGLDTAQQFRDRLALTAADLDYTPGRTWRSTDDTAIAASILRNGTPGWSNWRRGQDYYEEGILLWLDADTLIRQKTGGQRSLNDFLRLFLGRGGDTGAAILPYNRDEVIAALNQVLPYDWAAFFRERVDSITPHADLDGITRGGYTLVFTKTPTATSRTLSAISPSHDLVLWYSLGLELDSGGNLRDVRMFSAADQAGLAPGQRLVGVNGRVYSADALHMAIQSAQQTGAPIQLIVESDGFLSQVSVAYRDGERYPALERSSSTPALLDDILQPLAATKP